MTLVMNGSCQSGRPSASYSNFDHLFFSLYLIWFDILDLCLFLGVGVLCFQNTSQSILFFSWALYLYFCLYSSEFFLLLSLEFCSCSFSNLSSRHNLISFPFFLNLWTKQFEFMILSLNMAFTACPLRIDIESSSCLIIYHFNMISSLNPELIFKMVKALIHFIISFYLLMSM